MGAAALGPLPDQSRADPIRINPIACSRYGIPLARRLSGGGGYLGGFLPVPTAWMVTRTVRRALIRRQNHFLVIFFARPEAAQRWIFRVGQRLGAQSINVGSWSAIAREPPGRSHNHRPPSKYLPRLAKVLPLRVAATSLGTGWPAAHMTLPRHTGRVCGDVLTTHTASRCSAIPLWTYLTPRHGIRLSVLSFLFT